MNWNQWWVAREERRGEEGGRGEEMREGRGDEKREGEGGEGREGEKGELVEL